MIVESLQAALAADAGCQVLLGTPATRSDRTNGIFPVQAPDAVPMPYLVLSQVSGEPQTIAFEGTNALQQNRWRFSCYGSTYKNAKTLAKSVKFALLALNGQQTGSAFVMGSWLKLEADDAEPITRGTLWSTHLDFDFHFVDGDIS
jgi:hypothetical protein